jgi:hypothetical protein
LELRRRESLKSYKRVLGALVGLALGASLLVPGAAQADHSATYSVEVGQGLGLPGGHRDGRGVRRARLHFLGPRRLLDRTMAVRTT